MKILISFIGDNDLITDEKPNGGAVMNVFSTLNPEKVYLFYNTDRKNKLIKYLHGCSDNLTLMKKINPDIDCKYVPIVTDDPTEYDLLYPKMNDAAQRIIEDNGYQIETKNGKKEKIEYYVCITSGTPQMMFVWILLKEKGLIDATLLQSINKPYQKTNKGKPYREVNFSLDDFPKLTTPSSIKRQLTIEKREKDRLKQRVQINELSSSFKGFIGESKRILEIKEQLLEEIDSTTSVLILGEKGTGKEIIANEIWRLYRKDGDKELTNQDCGTIPEPLIETTLFGYVKGSHSQAKDDHPGLFETCDGKMLFLDEIGNLSVPSQKKMLRYLQFGTITPVGGTKTKKLNTQIIAATNKDTNDIEIFADDIKDRFDEIVQLPPLREYKEDIPLLTEHFIRLECKNRGLPGLMILNGELQEKMMDFNWPGNVRILEKFISKLVRKFGAQEVSLGNLPNRFIDIIRSSDNETDLILPDLPLNKSLHEVTQDFKNAILYKARSLSEKPADVDRLLKQKDVEKNRRYRARK